MAREQVARHERAVVLPTPPFGLINAIVFGRVTPGWERIRRSSSASSRSCSETSSRWNCRRSLPAVPFWRRPSVYERLRDGRRGA